MSARTTRIQSGPGWAAITASPLRGAGRGFIIAGLLIGLLALPIISTPGFTFEGLGRADAKLFGLAMLGPVWLVVGLLAFTHRQHIEVRTGALRVFHRPLPFSGRAIAAGELVELTIAQRQPKQGVQPHPCVAAKTRDGQTIDLISLETASEAGDVQLALGRALGPDVALTVA